MVLSQFCVIWASNSKFNGCPSYDNLYNIQQFKKDTKAEIASIRNRDEFGNPKDPNADADLTLDQGLAGVDMSALGDASVQTQM